LTPQVSSSIGIAGTFTNNGILDANDIFNTFNYNGTDQNVINPNGTIAGYYNLSISGSGIKTMPSTSMSVLGIFLFLERHDDKKTYLMWWNLSIVASSVLNAGTNILKVAGNFSSNGNFVVSVVH
jgi:hypothetical protein